MTDNPIPRIRCAVCKRQVDIVEWWDGDRLGSRIIRAHCHGATDTMELSFFSLTLDDLNQLKNQEGIAFATPAIAGPTT